MCEIVREVRARGYVSFVCSLLPRGSLTHTDNLNVHQDRRYTKRPGVVVSWSSSPTDLIAQPCIMHGPFSSLFCLLINLDMGLSPQPGRVIIMRRQREQGTRPFAWWGIHGNAESYGASPVLCYIRQGAAEGCWLRLYLLQPVTLT